MTFCQAKSLRKETVGNFTKWEESATESPYWITDDPRSPNNFLCRYHQSHAAKIMYCLCALFSNGRTQENGFLVVLRAPIVPMSPAELQKDPTINSWTPNEKKRPTKTKQNWSTKAKNQKTSQQTSGCFHLQILPRFNHCEFDLVSLPFYCARKCFR